MDGRYISQSIIIVIIFVLLQLSNVLAIGIKNIQDNWSLYRCNPLVIPMAGIFGHDPQKTFEYCSQNYNMNFSHYLLDPFKYIISNIGNFGKDIGKDLGGVINLAGSNNSGIFSIVSNLFGIATNTLASIQIIINGLKDTFSKIVGTLITFLYILKGIEIAIPSMLMTPPGEAILWIVKTLGMTAGNLFGADWGNQKKKT